MNTAPKRLREPVISIRPRRGSALEVEWLERDRNAAEMREIIHSWAEQFALSKTGEKEDD